MDSQVHDWAFTTTEEEARELYKQIPDDVDVLITHGPRYGHRDLTPGNVLGSIVVSHFVVDLTDPHKWFSL